MRVCVCLRACVRACTCMCVCLCARARASAYYICLFVCLHCGCACDDEGVEVNSGRQMRLLKNAWGFERPIRAENIPCRHLIFTFLSQDDIDVIIQNGSLE
jgi:hypothetical protein